MRTETSFSERSRSKKEAGQSIVIIALALVGMLAFVGIAVDVGFVFARQTQLQAAVDSAALAAVVELVQDTTNSTRANQKASQFLRTNGFNVTVGTALNPPQVLGIGRSLGVSALGAIQYQLTVTWPVELYFLRLIGQESVTLTRGAVAGIFPMADIYASRRIEDGLLSTSNQAVFGPSSCTSMGDPFSPAQSPWHPGLYTYNYRILIPPDYPHDIVRVELFDPDSMNQSQNTHTVQRSQTAVNYGLPLFADLSCSTQERQQPCLIDTGEQQLVLNHNVPFDSINPFWFVRIDENRHGNYNTNTGCGMPSSYMVNHNTQTTYELFYWAQNPDGTLVRIELATYTGQVGDNVRDNGNHLTDMQWVSPGAPLSHGQPAAVPTDCGARNGGDYDPVRCPGGSPIAPGSGFEISISQDLGSILVDPVTGNRFIYMDVTAISGASENGFEVWAGPNTYVNNVPSDANLRNLYILNNRNAHSSRGVTVFGMGRLPLNSNINFRVDIPLIWVGPEQRGQFIYVSMFDSDSGAQPPVHFYFDSIYFNPNNVSQSDYVVTYGNPAGGGRCVVGNCNDRWVNPAYEIRVPGDVENCTNPNANPLPPSCIPFYGGRLVASYRGGMHDTYGWEVRITGAPYLVR